MAVSVWLGEQPLLLASTSPTRRALLGASGIPVDTEVPGVDERAFQTAAGSMEPDALAAELAHAKALAVSGRRPGRIVVGADQVLACGNAVFAKAATIEGARDTLARLAGRAHRLISAACIARDGAVAADVADTADLVMRPLDPSAIARYVALAGAAATRSVGAYEIEGLGLHLFERVEGDHATILGLPLLGLFKELRAMNLLAI